MTQSEGRRATTAANVRPRPRHPGGHGDGTRGPRPDLGSRPQPKGPHRVQGGRGRAGLVSLKPPHSFTSHCTLGTWARGLGSQQLQGRPWLPACPAPDLDPCLSLD